nr:hypothetical protein [Blautia coccoides]
MERDFQYTRNKCVKISVADYKRLGIFTRIMGKVLRIFAPLM